MYSLTTATHFEQRK